MSDESTSSAVESIADMAYDGVLRIHDLQRPLRTAADIFARANAPRLAEGTTESLITSEGEYAAFQVQRGVIDGQRVERAVGAVFGDDSYRLVVGLTRAPLARSFLAVARMCVMRCSLGLGHRRIRRYRVAPPTGWTETAWGLATRWSAPDGDTIIAHPAQPHVNAERILDGIRGRYGLGILDETLAPPSACLARAWRGDGIHVVILDDGRFRYPVELRGSDTHRDVLARVVASIRLIPPIETTPITDALLHWIE